jgi:pyruvate,water dikinase
VTDLILWMDRTATGSATEAAGAKMGRLAELASIGVEVPRSFAVTVEAFRHQCAQTGLLERADELCSPQALDGADDAVVAEASAAARAAFVGTPVAEEIRAAVAEAYEELCDRCLDINVPVAVRSSATGEDSSSASFAGAFDTYLGMSGPDRVVDAVRRCWASLFTTRAVAYRARRGISHRDMPMAVGVVELVHARASGVAFSVHPVSGKADRVVIESSWGWGEAVVQGLVTPDHIEVGKSDGRILQHVVNSKDVVSAFDYAVGAVTEMPTPERLRRRASLDDEQIGRIVEAVREIEDHYGHPVDVEWVVSGHRRPGEPVSIVQTRPVTVAAAAGPAAKPGWDPLAFAAKYAFGGKG